MGNNEAPERIWIQPRYVNEIIPGGIFHVNRPPVDIVIGVQCYVREDLATCTVEERAVIEAAITDRLAILNEGSAGPDALNKAADRAIAARRELNSAVIALMVARAGKNMLTTNS